MAAQQQLGVGNTGGVVTRQFVARGDVAAGAERVTIGPPQRGLARVIEEAQLRYGSGRGGKPEDCSTGGDGRCGEQATPGDRRRAGGDRLQGQQLNVPMT